MTNAGAVGSTVPSFDALRAAVRSGGGIVARFPGLLVAASDGTGVERLLEICSEVSSARARAPGRALARRLAGWLIDIEEPGDFGVVAATDDALAVFLCGRATLLVPGEHPLSGTEAAAWVDRLIQWPREDFVLTLGATEPTRPPPFLDLRDGVVPGGGLLLSLPVNWSGGPPRPVVMPAGEFTLQGVPTPVPILSGERSDPILERPARSETINGVRPDEEVREPLPMDTHSSHTFRPSVPSVAEATESESTLLVDGFVCSRGHLNDPRSRFCASCGIRMDENTRKLMKGQRPPLGLLVFDDGASFTLDGDYVLGRQPDVDERVRRGEVRPLMIDDSSRHVSRAHLEVQLKGWDVYINDTGTFNGTYLTAPEEQAPSALVPGQPVRLPPGARVSIGSRSFVFESSLAR